MDFLLLIALHHKGQVLHQVAEQVSFFREEDDPLDVTEGEENEIYCSNGNKSGNGWNED